MTTRRLPLAALVSLLVALPGCASAPDAPPAGASGAGVDAGNVAAEAGACVSGTVILEGVQFASRTWARSATGVYVELAGPLVPNIRLLSGTIVRVCGPDREPDVALEATEVELLEVDGMPALLGTLREAAAGWAVEPLQGGEPVPLRDAPEAFIGAVGRIVWVAGERADDSLAVRSYGVLEAWR